METVAGVFRTRAEAEKAVQQIHAQGFSNDRIALLTPGSTQESAEEAVPTSDTESSGMGKAMGGAVGGALGAAGGATLGAAAASLLVPGVGPVMAGAILGAALLGIGGAATGVAAGEAMEDSLVKGLPHDELYLYEDAVEHGRSVVIAFAETDESRDAAESLLKNAGAESIDAARESWWLGLRDAEEAHYQTTGGNFQADESAYRRGFEAALSQSHSGETEKLDGAFHRGYERGQAYRQSIQGRYRR
ncbi:MAG TPA: hypothetical protein VJU86_04570 [Pyrinomonadaceae bacterium]|nr:hypothetical protein [Pyrinomonadaceae bacterium]